MFYFLDSQAPPTQVLYIPVLAFLYAERFLCYDVQRPIESNIIVLTTSAGSVLLSAKFIVHNGIELADTDIRR